LRPHARGGLGEVFVARDQELQREVAVKEMQASHADDPDSRKRFMLEAEITGSLEHPGIVPVYGLGQYADGRPFYAMRFIQGENLRDAIARFHKDDTPGRDPGERSLSLRQLLTRFVAVCNTVAYAHSRGILHRDLKPSNILLGKFGETLVVDWGLAKAMGSRTDEVQDKAELLFQPALGDPQLTQPGIAVGTPAYMSPEQATGQTSQLGPASDIYSLGATLYTLVTGQIPFAGSDKYAVLDKVRRGEWQSPRAVKPNVPPALEAVCQKAMALAPAERYATALDLAADVEHWLADEPVSAWQEPLSVRWGRWKRRHRAGVRVGIAAVGVTVPVLLVAMVLLIRANNTAQHRFKLTFESLNGFTSQIIEDPTLETEVPELRQKLLDRAVTYYEKLAEEEAGDQTMLVKAERGKVYWLLAELHYDLGRNDKAVDAAENAIKLFLEVSAAQPKETLFQRELARSYYTLGRVHLDETRYPESTAAWQKAIPIQEDLVRTGSSEAKHDLALTCSELVFPFFYDRGFFRDAEKYQRRALDLRKELADWNLPESERELAQSYTYLGNVYRVTGEDKQALSAFQQAEDIAHRLVASRTAKPKDKLTLASSYYGLGLTHFAAGRCKEALGKFQDAQKIERELNEKYYQVLDYPESLARTLIAVGAVYRELNQAAQAADAYQEALKLAKALSDRPAATAWYRFLEARVRQYLGIVHRETGRLEQAQAACQLALDACTKVADAHPKHFTLAINRGFMYVTQGDLLRDQGKTEKALASYDAAINTLQEALEKESHHVEVREYLDLAKGGRAVALAQLGKHALAEKALAEIREGGPDRLIRETRLARILVDALAGKHLRASEEADKLAQEKSSLSGRMLFDLACGYALCASAAGRDGNTAERLKRAARAIEMLRAAREAHYFRTTAAIERLRSDPALAALRSRQDYQQLVREVQPGSKTSSE
jgi:serine/threonine-protein kinase